MNTRRLSTLLLLLFLIPKLFAQIGGEGTYDFLNLTPTPRLAALGGKIASLDDPDLGLALYNPSLMNSDMHNQLAFSYVGYYAKIHYASAIYSRNIGKFGTVGLGIMQVNYGSFTRADETGTITGRFTASDMSINLIYSRTFDSLLVVGVNVKPLYSHLESYKSFGVAMDIGLNYHPRKGLFSAGIVFRNIGTMIKPYTQEKWQNLPFEIIAGCSKRLAHAPFRLVFTIHQLQSMSVYYKHSKSESISLGGSDNVNDSKLKTISNEALSHLIMGIEFVPTKSFCFRVGYNYQRRNEMKVPENTSSVGFSWGFGMRISKFQISYGQSRYHLYGASKYFSITTNLNKLFGWDRL